MTQHEILMLVAAPLLVLGTPMVVFLKALPSTWSRELARAGNNRAWLSIWRSITNPLAAWLIHAIALWSWHVPVLMEAVLHNEFVHAVQHLCFLLSALLFWWSLIHGRQSAVNYGVAILYVFTTALHSGLLGILLTFATRLWYPSYATTTQGWGLSPVEDQQFGGLIMWIPAGVVYIVAALALMVGWMKESEDRALRNEATRTAADPLAVSQTGLLNRKRRTELISHTSVVLLLAWIGILSGCDGQSSEDAASQMTGGGDPHKGVQLIRYYGCASCHTIPGIHGATALVGPPLDHMSSRNYIGGVVQNSPKNMIDWIENPKAIDSKTAMPNLHVTENDARDIASYLYTLR
jgi:cytochrome c oxidase assembly factor CtaG/cytochrome c2